ncbi:probable mitogen-activated protein kinase kinase kinase 11 at C-terminar half [Coccomyxa sp. Obi]|nr:probable mitogen-activated protein kinase kinase kinase 11 at C-terminar half [Coccomyxa sp. Obi]
MGCVSSKPAVEDGSKIGKIHAKDDERDGAKTDGAAEAPKLNGGVNGKEEKAMKLAEPNAVVPADQGPPSMLGKPSDAIENRPQENGFYGAPLPTNEKERHETLCACQILDSAPDPRFDDITKLLCSIFRVPIAIVSLVDTERQWFKSAQGLPGVTETSRATSFCAWTLLPKNPEVLIVTDALEDERFMENPLVTGAPHIRFYAGAPLVTSNGMRLGSLCVIDTEPRHLDAEQLMVLANFAEVVVREIEKDIARKEETDRLRSQTSGLIGAMDCFSEGIMLVNTDSEMWNILFVNDAWSRVTGFSREEALGKPVFGLFEIPGTSHEAAMAQYRGVVKKHTSFTLDLLRTTPDGRTFRYVTNFRPASTDALDNNKPIGIPGFAEWPSGQADQYYFVTVNEKAMCSLEEPMQPGQEPKWAPKQVGGKRHPWEDVELGPLIGQGSFGKVYRGVWNGAPVAVKIIHMANDSSLIPAAQQSAADPDFVAGAGLASATPSSTMRGALEAMHSVDLGHPNIVQTFKSTQRAVQSGQEGRSSISSPDQETCGRQFTETWLVLEYCDKGNLQDAVDRGVFNRPHRANSMDGPNPPKHTCNVAAVRETALEIASALAYLHDINILHGDLSGGNILLTSSSKDARKFTCKVADFGLSRVLSQEAISTGTFGTVTHMPPELLTTGRLSKSVDVYAFGVLLWEMCTGKRPWAGLMQMQVIFHVTIQNKSLEFPSTVPEELSSIGAKCMSKDPAERPTMKEVVVALERLEPSE